MSNYRPFFRGQTLKAEDLNHIQQWLLEVENKLNKHRDAVSTTPPREIARVLYTSFKTTAGMYEKNPNTEKIEFVSGQNRCSQYLIVKPNTTYYIGYLDFPNNPGCFFDGDKTPTRIPKISENDIISTGGVDYMYKITSGPNDRYFRYHLTSETPPNGLSRFLSSVNMIAKENTGNYLIYEDDPAYQEKKNKKLLVIGASGVSKNRTIEDGKLFIGFHEYLKLWYSSVGQIAKGGHSWRPDVSDSIPKLINAATDIADYDEFLLIPSTADIDSKDDVGHFNGITADTYFHGLNQVINYIYTKRGNKFTKIYLANMVHKKDYWDDNSNAYEYMDEINKNLKSLSDYKSYQLIDLASKMGINDKNYMEGELTSDNTHLNALGNYLQGMCIRKEIIGI